MGKGGCANPSSTSSKSTTSNGTNNIKSKSCSSLNQISYAELATKTTVDECWIAYDGCVYDVTQWLVKHPGGIRSIMSAAGSDASAVMKSLHTPNTLKVFMKRIRKVGILVDEITDETVSTSITAAAADQGKEKTNSDAKTDTIAIDAELSALNKRKQGLQRRAAIEQDFNDLNERLVKEGWYKPQPLRYASTIVRVVAMLLVGIYLIRHSQSTSTDNASFLYRAVCLTLGSMLIGFYFQNVAFAGHDAGHGSITGSFATDKVIGIIIGNLLTGIDMGWWKSTHYVHHSATNSLHDDPDIQHMPLLCLDERMADNRWSTYHGKYMILDAVANTLLPYQHLYFYPVLGVARINLYVQSVIYLIKTCPFIYSLSSSASSSSKSKAGESFIDETTGEVKEKYAWPKQSAAIWIASFVSLIIFYTTMIQFYLSLGILTGVYSFFVTHIAAGLLHVQILLSHICMHYCEDGPGTTGAITAPNGNDEAGYHEWQALSTMDIACPEWMDWFHGGLQFQLEHHIFPRVPRWNLRKLCKLTDEIYAKYDVPVVRMGFIEANRVMLRHIAEVGAKVTKAKTA